MVPVTKPYITFEGEGRDKTVIEWHDRAGDVGPNGQQIRTYRTASVTVFANFFSARNISFKVHESCYHEQGQYILRNRDNIIREALVCFSHTFQMFFPSRVKGQFSAWGNFVWKVFQRKFCSKSVKKMSNFAITVFLVNFEKEMHIFI